MEILHFGTPTTKQLNKINKYRPGGSDPYDKSEIYTVPIVASNNLLSHGNMVWSKDSIKRMEKIFPGSDFMLDHDWDLAEKTKGRVYDAEVITTEQAPPWATDGLDPKQTKESKGIIKTQGYASVIMYAAIPATAEAVYSIRFSQYRDVSIGGLAQNNYICPLCDIPFDHEDCPHIPPYPGVMWWLSEEEMKRLAPYYINDGLYDGIELSVVTDGACAAARIMSQEDVDWYMKQLAITV